MRIRIRGIESVKTKLREELLGRRNFAIIAAEEAASQAKQQFLDNQAGRPSGVWWNNQTFQAVRSFREEIVRGRVLVGFRLWLVVPYAIYLVQPRNKENPPKTDALRPLARFWGAFFYGQLLKFVGRGNLKIGSKGTII